MGRFRWSPYVPVAVRRAKALKKMQSLRKKGVCVRPVEIEGKKIARTFWGDAWCRHLEQFSDYENRLPRGRTYVRNGSVCHLEIGRGKVEAMVSGSRLYNVTVTIDEIPSRKWKEVKKRCAGRIGSILELLQGRLDHQVMEVVTDPQKGLFPLPKEIHLACSCPDWAVMCKHVAAVLYGVGARLDEEPALLFLLRGVNEEELITMGAEAAAGAVRRPRAGRIAEADLGEVFGIDLGEEDTSDPVSPKTASASRDSKPRRRKTSPRRPKAPLAEPKASEKSSPKKRTTGNRIPKVSRAPGPVTGRDVASLRARLDMTQGQFARLVGVSLPTVGNWEKKTGPLNLQTRTQKAWDRVSRLTKKQAWKRIS